MVTIPKCPNCDHGGMHTTKVGDYGIDSFWVCYSPGCRGTRLFLSSVEGTRSVLNGRYKPPRNVPDVISGIACEAHICFDIGAYRAVVVLARAAVEALAKTKGIEKGNLEGKIGQLFPRDEKHREACHRLRGLGNGGAHDSAGINREDAEEALELIDAVLPLAHYESHKKDTES